MGVTPLRVGFNAYLLASPDLRGWTRYTVNLLAALPAHGVRPYLYSNAPIHPDHLARLPAGSFEVRVAPPMRYLVWESKWVPEQLRTDRVDVFHCPMNYGMPYYTPCPRVLTLHDAIEQVYYGRRAGVCANLRPNALRCRLVHWVARCRADRIITVSEHAKQDIVRHLRVPEAKLSVVYEAADPIFHQQVTAERIAATRAAYSLNRPYFLYLGGWEGRKNVPFLIRAFAAAGLSGVELVLAGGKPHEQRTLAAVARAGGVEERVRFIGFVPEPQLPALYKGALAFVYPSEYEGFGLQICEAMAVGCPVLVALATCLPEIAGDGGETFPLESDRGLTDLLVRVARDDGIRESLCKRAEARSTDFAWSRTAHKTAGVYRTIRRGCD